MIVLYTLLTMGVYTIMLITYDIHVPKGVRKEIVHMVVSAVIAGFVLAPIVIALYWVKDKWERL